MDVSGPQCDGYHDYVKCVLREMKAEEKLITEQKIRIAQNLHDSLMFKLGINCSLDVTRILEEIRQENLTNETEETTRRAVGKKLSNIFVSSFIYPYTVLSTLIHKLFGVLMKMSEDICNREYILYMVKCLAMVKPINILFDKTVCLYICGNVYV